MDKLTFILLIIALFYILYNQNKNFNNNTQFIKNIKQKKKIKLNKDRNNDYNIKKKKKIDKHIKKKKKKNKDIDLIEIEELDNISFEDLNSSISLESFEESSEDDSNDYVSDSLTLDTYELDDDGDVYKGNNM